MYVQGERMVGLRGWMIVWCRRCSISPIVTNTDWGLYFHASSLSVLCIRGHLSPLHEASRRSGMLWSPLITWVHSQYCTIIYRIKELIGMNITCIMSLSIIAIVLILNEKEVIFFSDHYLVFLHNFKIEAIFQYS